MRYLLTKALIIKKQASGENDWFLTLFSPELGKIQALSRSSRKILSHKGSRLDPLNLCTFQLYKKNDRYWVTECQTDDTFPNIKNDLEKSLLAFTVLELLLRTVQEDEDNRQLFALTVHALESLSREKNELFLEEFKIKLLKLAGSWPDLSICDGCQKKWSAGDILLGDHEGRLFCQNCRQIHSSATQEISFNIMKLANYLSVEKDVSTKLKITSQDLFQLKKLTALFLGKYLHYELHSEKILQS